MQQLLQLKCKLNATKRVYIIKTTNQGEPAASQIHLFNCFKMRNKNHINC